jgi:hypothetical protein
MASSWHVVLTYSIMAGVQRSLEHRPRAPVPPQRFGVFVPGFFEKVVHAKWAAVLAPLGIIGANVIPGGRLPGSLCPIAALAGLPCPTCGLLRAMVLMARLDFRAALRYHPLVPLARALALGAGLLEVLPGGARRRLVAVGLYGAARPARYLLAPADWAFLLPRWIPR